MSEKIFNAIILVIVISASLFPKNTITWGELLTICVYGITAFAIGKQAFASKEQSDATFLMAKSNILPNIFSYMVFDSGKTYFWFRNASNVAGKIKIILEDKKTDKILQEQEFVIPPSEKLATSRTYEFNPVEGMQVRLKTNIRSLFYDSNKIESNFIKNYTFRDNKWDENTWGMPDPKYNVFLDGNI